MRLSSELMRYTNAVNMVSTSAIDMAAEESSSLCAAACALHEHELTPPTSGTGSVCFCMQCKVCQLSSDACPQRSIEVM